MGLQRGPSIEIQEEDVLGGQNTVGLHLRRPGGQESVKYKGQMQLTRRKIKRKLT